MEGIHESIAPEKAGRRVELQCAVGLNGPFDEDFLETQSVCPYWKCNKQNSNQITAPIPPESASASFVERRTHFTALEVEAEKVRFARHQDSLLGEHELPVDFLALANEIPFRDRADYRAVAVPP